MELQGAPTLSAAKEGNGFRGQDTVLQGQSGCHRQASVLGPPYLIVEQLSSLSGTWRIVNAA